MEVLSTTHGSFTKKMKVLPSSTQKTGDRMMMNDAYASHTF